MSSDHRKLSMTDNFCDKISRSIWIQTKEKGNSMKIKYYAMYINISLHVLYSGMNLVEAYKQCNVLGNGETVSKTGKNYLFPIVFQFSKT